MKNLQTYEEFRLNEERSIQEGAVKTFEMDFAKMVKNIKSGYGWIDPEFVADTWENSSDTIDFEIVKDEIYNRLIKAGLLFFADENDEEEKGKKVTNIKQIGESISEESDEIMKQEYSDAVIVRDEDDLPEGTEVKVDALEYSSKGDEEMVKIIRPDGNESSIMRNNLKIQI